MFNPLDLLSPPICAGCGKLGTRLCSECRSHLSFIDPDWDLVSLLQLPPVLGHVWSAVEYRDLATTIVKQIKYDHYYDYCQLIGDIMAKHLGPSLLAQSFTGLVPVPLAPARQRWRGFNQAAKIAQALGQRLNIRVQTQLLARQQAKRNQASLDRQQRQNLHHDFVLNPAFNLTGQRLCLIDDVITTGATLQACTQLCRAAGAQVEVATFAVTVSGKV